jgi:PucR family transcriptional regulator, purine catabolism regulatory protein
MTDLAAVARELFPGSVRTPPVGRDATGRKRRLPQISWVRVMRGRVPAFDAVDPGDLVIVSAAALGIVAPGAAELHALVAALAAVPVSGAILVGAEPGAAATSSVALAAAGAALASAGVDAVTIDRGDVAEVERSVIGFIVAEGAELERQASLLEAELRRRSLEGGGVTALVATVSSFLGRALALETGRGAPIVVHAPAEAPGAAAEAARYDARGPGGPERVALRVELPSATGVAGNLLVLGPEPASELARVTLPRVAGLIALELARDEAVRGAVDRARRTEPMPAAGPPWVVVLARQRELGGEDDTPAGKETREAVRRAIRLLAPARRMSLRGDADSVEIRAVVAGDLREAEPVAERIGELLGRPAALSRAFSTPADRPTAEAEARSTLEAALALERPPRLARADRLALYRMLGAMHKLPDGRQLALAVLAPLLDARPDVRRERLETLRAVLGHGGVGEAAAALGVHRNTVAYRLRRIEAATGWQLADAQLRLPLAAALEFVQEDQI